MTWEMWFVAAVVVAVLVILVRDVASPAATMVGAMVLVLVTGIVEPSEALAGFANPAPITVAALYILARAVEKTGALTPLIRQLLGSGEGTRRALARLVIPTGVASAFLNNTPIVAMLVPQVRSWCEENGLSPSKFMMPLSFAAILGGVITVIGTSTNIVVSGLMVNAGIEPIGFFEIGAVGIPIAIIGLLLMVALSPSVLPERRSVRYEVEGGREFVTEMRVDQDGPLDGEPVENAGLRHLSSVFLATIERGGHLIAPVTPNTILVSGDVLRFVGQVEHVVDLSDIRGLTPVASDHMSELDLPSSHYFEAVVGASSPLVGTTLRRADFRRRYQGVVVAIHRAGHLIDAKLGEVPLRVGDTLLILAEPGFGERWSDRHDFLLISEPGRTPNVTDWRAFVVGLVTAGIVVLASTGVIPILQASLLGAIILIATRALTPGEAGAAVDLDVVLLIASAFGLAAAVAKSGLGTLIAETIVDALEVFGPTGILAGILLTSTVLTGLITNNAAALLMFPIAISTAEVASVDPRSFVMAIAVGASLSFLTPIGYQTNIMVYSPGGYRFGDYARLGWPLTVASIIIFLIVAPMAWPF
ncbi:MAG: SLC13 family permease [Acidimicrobiia bacterium]|nr:SLC13 family permease [Acidimicrobiia bacterium]